MEAKPSEFFDKSLVSAAHQSLCERKQLSPKYTKDQMKFFKFFQCRGPFRVCLRILGGMAPE